MARSWWSTPAGHEHVVTAGDVVHLRPWNPAATDGQGESRGGAESGYA